MKHSELFARAVVHADALNLDAKGKACEFQLGGYRWIINGGREPVEGVPEFHLGVLRGDLFVPVCICNPRGGQAITNRDGTDDVEGDLIKLLVEANPEAQRGRVGTAPEPTT